MLLLVAFSLQIEKEREEARRDEEARQRVMEIMEAAKKGGKGSSKSRSKSKKKAK